ncbi:cyclopropane-fatty-acyl-phospholipid synthase family protein [Phenylobacterium sp.]|uniref:SAM-dependent methyltransferase n=1 Tax=Phenylobacterium sp. TaxID=1871053 RepID=UPI00271D719A|nr:cyclopropane-fatty-acyl-phospholipid synthase family protein [Phenylobacterium sp.]MDO8378996.1 cyclopropane-fatty-acyl-phospholipid synthase family protein [Phenylobacterium sp.]
MTLAHESSLVALAASPRAFRRLPALADVPEIFRTALRLMARNWMAGELTFVMPNGHELKLEGEGGPQARIVVRDFRFIRRALAAGDIGFAEGYAAGEWDTPNLTAVLSVFSLNYDNLRRITQGNPIVGVFNFINHALRSNTRQGSRRNIHAHYDLGNDFYSRWLDASMTYSSARFDHAGQSLAEAQRNKYATLAQTMDLRAGQSVLEIGCGWGGFAEFAAKEVGARVTGITISQAQYDFARKRMFDQGLAEKADIQLIDYRDVEGTFDRVASIEMFEAVGERYWPTYFSKISQVLAPGGRAGLQIITIQEALFEDYRRRADFIQKYIFPGGMLPSESRLQAETDKAGLAWTGVSRFGQDYADTLAQWSERFDARWDEIKGLGFDEKFRKIWRFYLSYCDAGFRTRRTDVVQLGLSKA